MDGKAWLSACCEEQDFAFVRSFVQSSLWLGRYIIDTRILMIIMVLVVIQLVIRVMVVVSNSAAQPRGGGRVRVIGRLGKITCDASNASHLSIS